MEATVLRKKTAAQDAVRDLPVQVSGGTITLGEVWDRLETYQEQYHAKMCSVVKARLEQSSRGLSIGVGGIPLYNPEIYKNIAWVATYPTEIYNNNYTMQIALCDAVSRRLNFDSFDSNTSLASARVYDVLRIYGYSGDGESLHAELIALAENIGALLNSVLECYRSATYWETLNEFYDQAKVSVALSPEQEDKLSGGDNGVVSTIVCGVHSYKHVVLPEEFGYTMTATGITTVSDATMLTINEHMNYGSTYETTMIGKVADDYEVASPLYGDVVYDIQKHTLETRFINYTSDGLAFTPYYRISKLQHFGRLLSGEDAECAIYNRTAIEQRDVWMLRKGAARAFKMKYGSTISNSIVYAHTTSALRSIVAQLYNIGDEFSIPIYDTYVAPAITEDGDKLYPYSRFGTIHTKEKIVDTNTDLIDRLALSAEAYPDVESEMSELNHPYDENADLVLGRVAKRAVLNLQALNVQVDTQNPPLNILASPETYLPLYNKTKVFGALNKELKHYLTTVFILPQELPLIHMYGDPKDKLLDVVYKHVSLVDFVVTQPTADEIEAQRKNIMLLALTESLIARSKVELEVAQTTLGTCEAHVAETKRELITAIRVLETQRATLKGLLDASEHNVERAKAVAENIIIIPGINHAELVDNLLIFRTDSLVGYVPLPDGEVSMRYFGSFEVVLNLSTGEPMFKQLEPAQVRNCFWTGGGYHPHISASSGKACLGNLEEMLALSIAEHAYDEAVMAILNFLQTANCDDAAGERFTSWDECDEHGNITELANYTPYSDGDDEDYGYCSVCDERLHYDELYTCQECGESACIDHRQYIYVRTSNGGTSEEIICDSCTDSGAVAYINCPMCGESVEDDLLIYEVDEEGNYAEDCTGCEVCS